ncbi:hypothetical protein GBA52_001905 [Prunus armeniaca]|nr:hypothetical protein GBA52_001905 [Prunus armeniaca]
MAMFTSKLKLSLLLFLFSLAAGNVVYATVFTLQNRCTYTVWPGTLSGNGAAVLGDGGCVADLNGNCPPELRVTDSGKVVACRSACAAFNAPEFCCTGDHATPQTCSPTQYSVMFKTACPTAYSYAYDDASSTCTCAGSDYLITFCPTGSS